MKRRSIRWQLPLSYAGIACIAALSLGTVLMTVLENFYTQQEINYLNQNAVSIGRIIGNMIERDAPEQRIENQLRMLSFFSATRIQLFDPQGDLLADSGGDRQFYLSYSPDGDATRIVEFEQAISPDFDTNVDAAWFARFDDVATEVTDFVVRGSIALPSQEVEEATIQLNTSSSETLLTDDVHVIPVNRSIYGISFVERADFLASRGRSDQDVRVTLRGQNDHSTLGFVQLSEGPAYGDEILESVARGWLMAGGFSVAFAGLVGWFFSRRITQPLLVLTDATSQMAHGDLSVRVDLDRKDELGTLSGAFNDMAGQIERVVTTLRRFVADAAHELHTPLTALRTNIELAHETASSDESALALVQVQRMQSLADDLLDLSRIESQPKQHEKVDFGAIVREMSAIYASRAEQKDVSFDLCLPDDPVDIPGDPAQLKRMVSNLLDNAVKFTDAGGGVSVKVSASDAMLQLDVNDNGIGIPEDDLPHLFERFHRGRNTANYPGSGLGLAIVHAVVTAHRGEVMAHSNGHGTCFCMRLPLS